MKETIKMAIPIILGAAALVSAGYGAKKAVDAKQKNSEAESINEQAQELIDDGMRRLQSARKLANEELANYGRLKVNVYESTLNDFVRIFKRIKNIDQSELIGLDELKEYNTTLVSLEQGIHIAKSMATGIIAGSAAGALTAFGAYGAVTSFATASTGTAIATLSGAAATNATLAFLGGGSLAAGGLGVAGGTAVLGGAVAGPLIAVFGAVLDSKATENLENAKSNRRQAESHVKELEITIDSCNHITRRVGMFSKLLQELNNILIPGVERLEDIVFDEGRDFQAYTRESQKVVAMVASLSKAVSSIINSPILDEAGALVPESLDTYYDIEMHLESGKFEV